MKQVNNSGFSLLELLLVLALMSLLVSLALPMWQDQQASVRRQLAWLDLQHIALAQTEYKQQTGSYAQSIDSLGILVDDTAYIYTLEFADEAYTIHAQVREPGPQQLDATCWQLVWHGSSGSYALNKDGSVNDSC